MHDNRLNIINRKIDLIENKNNILQNFNNESIPTSSKNQVNNHKTLYESVTNNNEIQNSRSNSRQNANRYK